MISPLKIMFPEQLPISQRAGEIARAVRDHQVVVVAGETGSGKTTQLPKICLQLGRGTQGLIGHTQPRRLAARTVADRIAEELGTSLGGVVGYQVRFSDQVSPETRVKLMTDGILLTEIGRDRLLRRYDTLIIDEAHERSLNIDFILGYLKQLLPRRPDLKVIITSATIDPVRFARHFGEVCDPERHNSGEALHPESVSTESVSTESVSTESVSPEAVRTAPNSCVPVIEVSGRTYPVELRYRPLVDGPFGDEAAGSESGTDAGSGSGPGSGSGSAGEPRDQIQGITDAVSELAGDGPGDILVFLSGEREIRDTADALRGVINRRRDLAGTEVLPLFARLSIAEQHRVFQPTGGRRIVLATNVAETSLTVPGIRYVVDPGTARISRYSYRLKVQRLPIEPISQAAARQRAGRCGRVADGICVRLYAEEDYEARPAFTEPEILRTNLASVILQMTALRLGPVESFPFLDPPDRRQISDGVRLLVELGALDQAGVSEQSGGGLRLTPLGRQLAQLPIDPRLGRMVVEAHRNGCADEVIVIAAALSIQDPRERPADKQEAADQSHARFAAEGSDFLGFLNLWNYVGERQRELSSSQFRRMCRAEFLNYLRVREWQDLCQQLRRSARSLDTGRDTGRDKGRDKGPGAAEQEPTREIDPDRIHTSLLAGLLSHLGMKDERAKQDDRAKSTRTESRPRGRGSDYLGARGSRFAIAPGSVLFRRSPQWVMVAELVETSRLWGRVAAAVEPEWVEPLAGHLVKRSYSEPHWEKKRGSVVAYEKVTLYGVPVVARRKVNFGRIDPELSRELFIRHALVEGDWETCHGFFHHNRARLEQVAELEHRARRRDIVVDDETLFSFYDQRLDRSVVSAAHFDRWWKERRRADPELLTLTEADLVSEAAGRVTEVDYPDRWPAGELAPPLTYEFSPGSATDGVTVHLHLTDLDRLDPAVFEWQVPGLRQELVVAMIRSLPKPIRRQLVPVPDVAADLLTRLTPYRGRLAEALADELLRDGVRVPPEAWEVAKVPPHLRPTFRITDARGQVLAEGKELPALVAQVRPRVRASLSAAAAGIERRDLSGWTIGDLPRQVAVPHGDRQVTVFPALTVGADGETVDLRVFGTEAEQAHHMRLGIRRLLLAGLPSPASYVSDRLAADAKLVLLRNPHGGVARLLGDCAECAVDALVAAHGGPAWDEAAFAALRNRVRAELNRATLGVVTQVLPVLSAAHEVQARLERPAGAATAAARADLRLQLSELIRPGFVADAGWQKLPDLQRYLEAMLVRLDRLPSQPDRDQDLMDVVHDLQAELDDLRDDARDGARGGARGTAPDELGELRWMLEELRVSLFAQKLRTAYPVSAQRVRRAFAAAAGR